MIDHAFFRECYCNPALEHWELRFIFNMSTNAIRQTARRLELPLRTKMTRWSEAA